MESETLLLRTGVRSEVYEQTHLEVMVDNLTDDVSATLTSIINPVPTKQTIVGGWSYNGASHQQSETDEKEKIISNNSLPIVSDPPLYFNSSNSSLYTPNGKPIGITISASGAVQEIYLRKVFVMPENHEFYCPNCRVCVDKVLFCQTGGEGPSIEPNLPVSRPPRAREPAPTPSPQLPHFDEPVRCSECFSYLIQKGKDFIRGLVSPIPDPAPPQAAATGERAESSRKGWEILKSIVYGGLAQLLASLSVVTSAASADATTVNILALSVANLVGGFSVLAHNLRDLKASKPREGGNETDAGEDKYYELLGRRENYFLHAFIAILSLLIFGLVPPIAYGFSFRESNDKDLKLAAVAGVSAICIALLAAAKAYTQRPNNYMTYLKTITFYVTSGVLASLLTYLAGDLVKRLIEQLGWFQAAPAPAGSNIIGLSYPGIMTVHQKLPGLGSY